jgi:hypothetical protein
MRLSTRIAIVVIVCCTVAITVIAMRPGRVSDSQQIQGQLDSAVLGANQHSIGRIMSIVSADYGDESSLDSDMLREFLVEAYKNNPVVTVTNSPADIFVTGSTATSESMLTISIGTLHNQTQNSHNLKLNWKKEQAYNLLLFPTTVWRVVHADYGSELEGAQSPYGGQ